MERDAQLASKAVPRFASFRSDVLPAPTPKQTEFRGSVEPSPSHRHRDGSRKRHRRSRKQRSPSLTSGPVVDSRSVPKQQFVNWEESPATFTIDINGDYRNLEDKTNYEVPTYFLPENRIALGSKTGLGPVAHRPALPNRSNNSISQQIVKDVKHQNMLRINAKATPRSEVGEAADYVPLRQSKLRKRKWVDPTEEETSPKTLGNRPHNLIGSESGLGSAPLADNEYTTDMTSSDDDSARTLMLDKGKRQRRATLSSQVEQEPSKWQTWLALVGVQDEMDGLLGVSSQLSHTTAERRSNAEIDLSIYEKALRSVTDPEGRERLYLGMMSKAPLVWETSKTSSKWQMILNEHPASQKLWKRYLRFHQSLWSAFSVEETRKHYLDCLNMLRGVRESVNVELNLHSRIYFVQVYILLRLTLLLREGDYSELAVAIWQALLEFEFNKPYHLRCPAQQRPCRTRYDESLSAFETFWESEAPRIGEANAKGWLNYQDGDDEQEPPPAAVEPLPRPDSSALETWADAEREAHNSSKTPSRSIDGSGEDLYKVVFFSDIKPALIESPTCSDHHAILAAFLCFCHLPPYANDPTHYMGVWYNDQFVRNELLYDESSLKRPRPFKADNAAVNGECHASSTAADNMYDPSPPDLFAFPLAEHPVSSETLFSAPGRWFSVFERRLQIGGPVPTEFILATLKTITNQGVGDDDLAEYLLAFELQVSPATVLKSAKSLLRKRPSSLRLYNAYALVHNQLGNVEMANTVFDTAIQSSVKLDDVARRDVVVLWRSRIWKDLESGQTTLALDRLLQFDLEGGTKGRADDNGNVLDMKSATSYLRLQNTLSAGRDHMLSLNIPSHAILYSELLVLLSYLSNSTSLQAALHSFTPNLRHLTKNLTPQARTAEALFRQSFARLLYTHIAVLKRPYSPRTIRSFLAESIVAFPQNTIFLSLYAWNESRFRIDDRVRGIMQDILSISRRRSQNTQEEEEEGDNIIAHHFAIHTDLHRGLSLGSNIQAIRGTFERALQSEGAAHSAGLWRLYFLFEHTNGEMKRARDVFYRGMRACPWVKEIYMLAFELLSSKGMGEEELRWVYEMMVERELRIRVAI